MRHTAIILKDTISRTLNHRIVDESFLTTEAEKNFLHFNYSMSKIFFYPLLFIEMFPFLDAFSRGSAIGHIELT